MKCIKHNRITRVWTFYHLKLTQRTRVGQRAWNTPAVPNIWLLLVHKKSFLLFPLQLHMKVCKRIPLECVNKCGAKDIPREEVSYSENRFPNVQVCMVTKPLERGKAFEYVQRNLRYTDVNLFVAGMAQSRLSDRKKTQPMTRGAVSG